MDERKPAGVLAARHLGVILIVMGTNAAVILLLFLLSFLGIRACGSAPVKMSFLKESAERKHIYSKKGKDEMILIRIGKVAGLKL